MKNIFIVDDDVCIGDMLEELLTRERYGTARAYSGTEALMYLSSNRPDLILLDLMLPGLSGEELLARMPQRPVLITSDWDRISEFLFAGERMTEIHRVTKETDVYIRLNLDGTGDTHIATGLGFFDHMLSLLAFHSNFDIDLVAQGDLEVCDHHTIEEDVNCELLVHPTVMEEQFHTLCGAGVAYECIRALRTDTEYELELACVASIGDVMQVTNQTRAIIQNGLKVLNREKENHLFAFASDRILNETSVGFQIVPKLNAVGRLSNLGNVNNVVRYFLSEDLKEITSMQAQINHINDLRKKMSEQMCKDALKKCHTSQPILFVNDASFHEGIIGLVAGSLSSSYQKPVIVMTNNEQGFKASMRAPDGFDCMEFLKDFSGFQEIGGHKQAAGFSIDLQDLDEFVKYIRQKIQVYSWQAKPLDTLLVNEEDISIASIESLDVMRPFGPGFVCPLFELNDVQIKSVFDIQNGKHRKFTLQSGLQCMNFNQSDLDRDKSVISIAGFIGNVQINQYRGKKQATFIIEKIKYK